MAVFDWKTISKLRIQNKVCRYESNKRLSVGHCAKLKLYAEAYLSLFLDVWILMTSCSLIIYMIRHISFRFTGFTCRWITSIKETHPFISTGK